MAEPARHLNRPIHYVRYGGVPNAPKGNALGRSSCPETEPYGYIQIGLVGVSQPKTLCCLPAGAPGLRLNLGIMRRQTCGGHDRDENQPQRACYGIAYCVEPKEHLDYLPFKRLVTLMLQKTRRQRFQPFAFRDIRDQLMQTHCTNVWAVALRPSGSVTITSTLQPTDSS